MFSNYLNMIANKGEPVSKQETEVHSGRELPKLEREKALKLLRSKRHALCSYFWFAKSSPFCVSTRPFPSLKRTFLRELRVNYRALNFYLLLKTVDVYFKHNMMGLVVEDENGDLSFCQITNFIFINQDRQNAQEFSSGTVFVIKEPCVKECTDDTFVVFVTSPSDVIRITRNHTLFPKTVTLGWNSIVRDPRTASGWKDKGNSFFRLKNYSEAIEAYSMGLKQTPNENLQLALHLNLSATYLAAGCYESCLEYAKKVLQLDPINNKALYRAGRANYELGLYREAMEHFEKAVLEHSNKEASLEVKNCKMRIREQDGVIDEFDVLQYSHKNPGINIDFGDYQGPVKIVNVPGKYRGLVASRDLKPGTIIVAEKAAASETFELDFVSDDDMYITDVSVSQVVSALYKNPKRFKRILDLSCGQTEEIHHNQVFCDEEYENEIIIDVRRIHEILKINAFGYTLSNFEKAVSLFPFSSYINHSCLCNSSTSHYNNVIIIRTMTYVKEGDEITIHYKGRNEPQITDLSFYEFSCTCAFCNLERQESREIKEKRAQLVGAYQNLHYYEDDDYEDSIYYQNKLEQIIEDLKETYGQRETLTTALFLPYFKLAMCVKRQSAVRSGRERIMDLANKALECLGLSVDVLLCCLNDHYYLPKEAFISNINFLLDVSYLILFVQSTPESMKRWYEVLVMLERISSGGGLNFLKLKYPKFDKLSTYINSL